MKNLIDKIQSEYPKKIIHPIKLGDSLFADRQKSIFGHVNTQIAHVCEELEKKFPNTPEIDALGFSQGGQFLRAFVQRCNRPKVRNLITVGSQHQGISNIGGNDTWWKRLIKKNAYSWNAQSTIVPAQYWKDPSDIDVYLNQNDFLADINLDRAGKTNGLYKKNLMSLNLFAMFIFKNDTLMYPKESAWFGIQDPKNNEIIPLEKQQIYKKDLLGMKKLNEEGKLIFKILPGDHVRID